MTTSEPARARAAELPKGLSGLTAAYDDKILTLDAAISPADCKP